MTVPRELRSVLAEGRSLRLVEDGIYSALSDTPSRHHYDKRAGIYDLVVGTRLYNAAVWGCSPRDYVAFAREAITSQSEGEFLDAGCGSLLFTAQVYIESKRQIIAFDQSLSMLRRARKRLINLAGSLPEHILLLQADLKDLPFRPDSFRTVLCLNVLHQFKDAATLILNFKRLLNVGGHLYLTSLVTNGRFIGDNYLNALHAAGEFVRPRSETAIKKICGSALGQEVICWTKGNMAFVVSPPNDYGMLSWLSSRST